MEKIKVLIDTFVDKDNKNKEITVIRNGKEIKVYNGFLLKGDVYEITKDRYKKLSKLGIVEKIKDTKNDNNQVGD